MLSENPSWTFDPGRKEGKETKNMKMRIVIPTIKDAAKILGNSEKIAHASKCGTCACKCACRYNIELAKSPW